MPAGAYWTVPTYFTRIGQFVAPVVVVVAPVAASFVPATGETSVANTAGSSGRTPYETGKRALSPCAGRSRATAVKP